MFIIVTDKAEVSRCQARFEEGLRNNLSLYEKRDVGYQGGTVKDMAIYADGKEGFWFGTMLLTKSLAQKYAKSYSPRCWNAFGFGAEERGALSITVEINVPLDGINNRIQGLFAKDTETGRYFILHRGKINVGRKGIRKGAYKDFYGEELVEVKQSTDTVREVIPIADINDPFDGVRRFVENVRDCKRAIKAGKSVDLTPRNRN